MKNLKPFYNYINEKYGSLVKLSKNHPIFPFSKVNVLITRKCNERCSFCRVYDDLGAPRPDALTFDEWKKTLLPLPKFTTVSFSGGEPTTVPFLFDLIKELSDAGKYSAIVTNGTFIKPEDAKKICDSKLMYMMISVHGTQEIHDKVTNLKGGYQKVVENIRAINKYKADSNTKYPIIGIKSIVTEENYKELEKFCDSLDELNIADLHFNILNDSVLQHRIETIDDLSEACEDYKYHQYDKDKVDTIRESVKNILEKKYNYTVGFSNDFQSNRELVDYFGNEDQYQIKKCTMPMVDLTIHENGDVSPCHSVRLTNMKEIDYDVRKIKKIKKYRDYVNKVMSSFPNPKVCQGCNYGSLSKI
ncbi:radical SAM protein [Bacteriovoracaceae bacterium]|nr:radical SAM protein [Bacteriovoracaceae bacterium]